MQIVQQVLFAIVTAIAIWLFSKKVKEIFRNIMLGRAADYSDNKGIRWKNVLLLAFGQKKMFKKPLVAFMHFIIYAGFIIINLEILEIVLDGLVGTHRMFAGPLGALYSVLINSFEFLAVGVIAVCVAFLVRRNIIKLRRFIHRDLNGWPRSDANYILIMEIILMTLFLTMNASDTLLQQRGVDGYAGQATGNFFFSQWLHPLLNGMSNESLVMLERTAWWVHILGIYAFLNYLPYSKHLHIVLAFPNAYYARLEPQGKMKNMPEVQKEVLYAMQPELATDAAPPARFGAKDVSDLTWRNLLDAYSCTECGRCSEACPATKTGKLLSPRAIMMKTRDRLEEFGRNIKKLELKEGKKLLNTNIVIEDGKTLLHDYITVEELRACTSCQACVEACPVAISPLEIILDLRRSLVMEESNAPGEWNAMFSNVENNYAPWKFSPEERAQWAAEMENQSES